MEKRTGIIKKAIAVFLAFLAVYLIYHGIRALRKNAELSPATPETVYDTVTLDGAFFEEKTVVAAEKKGVAVLLFEMGEKVAKDAPLANIYPEKERKSVERLDALLRQIYKLERDARLVPISDKALLEAYENALLPLTKERDSLLAALGTPLETVYAEVSGYAYPENGCEAIFSAAELPTLDAEALGKCLSATPKTGSTPAFALLTDHRRFYAAAVSKETAERFSLGAVYSVSDDRSLPVTLTEKRGADSVLLIFSLDSGLTKYEGGKESLTLVREVYRGLRVPEKALREMDGKTFVFVFSEGAARLREVKVLTKEKDFVLVSDAYESPSGNAVLQRNDLVFAKAKGLYDGKLID